MCFAEIADACYFKDWDLAKKISKGRQSHSVVAGGKIRLQYGCGRQIDVCRPQNATGTSPRTICQSRFTCYCNYVVWINLARKPALLLLDEPSNHSKDLHLDKRE